MFGRNLKVVRSEIACWAARQMPIMDRANTTAEQPATVPVECTGERATNTGAYESGTSCIRHPATKQALNLPAGIDGGVSKGRANPMGERSLVLNLEIGLGLLSEPSGGGNITQADKRSCRSSVGKEVTVCSS